MLLRKLVAVRKVDAELPGEVKSALVDSLYTPFASLVVGAVSGGVIGMMVWYRAEDPVLAVCSVSIFLVGVVRVLCALAYRRRTRPDTAGGVRRWERIYEIGAWTYSGMLGLLCFLSVLRSTDGALHLVVATTTAGYAAGITGRNAGRPFIAIGQLTFAALPLSIALLLYGDSFHFGLGLVLLLFVYGMTDITLGIREIIVQALVSTRENAALASRYGEQANRFDAALNNMSHGLCMFDKGNRLLVWNERFLELSGLPRSSVTPGASVRELVRASVRRGNHPGARGSQVLFEMHKGLTGSFTGQMLAPLGDGRTIALSRRMMADWGVGRYFRGGHRTREGPGAHRVHGPFRRTYGAAEPNQFPRAFAGSD